MGVEYEHYLIPDDPTYQPDARQISRLINVLCDARYLPHSDAEPPGRTTFEYLSDEYDEALAAGCVADLGDERYTRFPCPCTADDVSALSGRDFRLIWSVEDRDEAGLTHPLLNAPEDAGWVYWDFELHVPARDYVYHTSSIIEPFDRTVACRCGQVLEYHGDPLGSSREPVFVDMRIHRTCPRCGTPFRPQDHEIRLKWGRTGEDIGPRPGGAVYLFAILIDCGKCYDRDGPRSSEECLRLCEDALGARLFPIGDFPGL